MQWVMLRLGSVFVHSHAVNMNPIELSHHQCLKNSNVVTSHVTSFAECNDLTCGKLCQASWTINAYLCPAKVMYQCHCSTSYEV